MNMMVKCLDAYGAGADNGTNIGTFTAIMVLSHNAGLYTGMVQVIALNHTTVTRF